MVSWLRALGSGIEDVDSGLGSSRSAMTCLPEDSTNTASIHEFALNDTRIPTPLALNPDEAYSFYAGYWALLSTAFLYLLVFRQLQKFYNVFGLGLSLWGRVF